MAKKMNKNKYYEKYKELYKKAQKTGKYKMFVFDVKSSRKIYANSPEFLEKSLKNFVDAITKDLLNLEKQLNKKILHRHLENSENYDSKKDVDKVVLYRYQSSSKKNVYVTDALNPIFYLGDLIQLILLKDSIPDKTFYQIFEKNRKEIVPSFKFSHKCGYYETDVWSEKDVKFHRSFATPIFTFLAKYPEEDVINTEDELTL